MRCEHCTRKIGRDLSDHRETAIGLLCLPCWRDLVEQEAILDAEDDADDERNDDGAGTPEGRIEAMPEFPMLPEEPSPECMPIHQLAQEAHDRGNYELAGVLLTVCGAVETGAIGELARYLRLFATNQINAIDARQRRN